MAHVKGLLSRVHFLQVCVCVFLNEDSIKHIFFQECNWVFISQSIYNRVVTIGLILEEHVAHLVTKNFLRSCQLRTKLPATVRTISYCRRGSGFFEGGAQSPCYKSTFETKNAQHHYPTLQYERSHFNNILIVKLISS